MLPFRNDQEPPWVIVAGGINRLGGMDKANLALAEYLLRRGVKVHAVSHGIEPDLAKHPGICVETVPIPGKSRFAGERLLSLAGRKLARRVLKQHPAARVVVNGGNCAWGDINWVHYVHQAWLPRATSAPWRYRVKHGVAGRIFRRQERRNVRAARLLLANSELTRRHLTELLLADPQSVHTVYLGAESDWVPARPGERKSARSWFGITGNQPLIAFIGALGEDRRKGLDILWGAWQKLCRFPEWDAHLIIAGDGRALPQWKAEMSRSPFRDRIQLLGFTEQIRELLAAADLLVSPVRYESFGLNVQEALCRGVPAIVSANAGVAERYSPELRPLLLPNPEDVDDLVRRMLIWRANIPYWRDQACNLSKTLRTYTWHHMAERIYHLSMEHARAFSPSHRGFLSRTNRLW